MQVNGSVMERSRYTDVLGWVPFRRSDCPWVGPSYALSTKRHWVFHGTVAGGEEVILPVWLLAASSVPIQRHTKVKGEANPCDPAWEPYFEERFGVKTPATWP